MEDELASDDLKLIAYTIVFAKRGREVVMPRGGGTRVETESLTETEFVGGLIADYTAQNCAAADFKAIVRIAGDLRYLKVQYTVSARWPREPLDKGRREAEALEAVRDVLGGGRDG
jgi:hypothetical protein